MEVLLKGAYAWGKYFSENFQRLKVFLEDCETWSSWFQWKLVDDMFYVLWHFSPKYFILHEFTTELLYMNYSISHTQNNIIIIKSHTALMWWPTWHWANFNSTCFLPSVRFRLHNHFLTSGPPFHWHMIRFWKMTCQQDSHLYLTNHDKNNWNF